MPISTGMDCLAGESRMQTLSLRSYRQPSSRTMPLDLIHPTIGTLFAGICLFVGRIVLCKPPRS